MKRKSRREIRESEKERLDVAEEDEGKTDERRMGRVRGVGKEG
jgi:hypothetical protein